MHLPDVLEETFDQSLQYYYLKTYDVIPLLCSCCILLYFIVEIFDTHVLDISATPILFNFPIHLPCKTEITRPEEIELLCALYPTPKIILVPTI